MRRDGLTLLETMVALVILGLVVLGFLAVFQGSARLAADSETWSQAVAYAADAMEAVKIGAGRAGAAGVAAREALPGGFERQIESQAWREGVRLVTVSVLLPGGGRVTLHRLVEAR